MSANPGRSGRDRGAPALQPMLTCLLAAHDGGPVTCILLDAQVQAVECLPAPLAQLIYDTIRHGEQLRRKLEAFGHLSDNRQVAAQQYRRG